jgi:hypothetical protein
LWKFCHNARADRSQRRPVRGFFGEKSVAGNVANGSMPLPDRDKTDRPVRNTQPLVLARGQNLLAALADRILVEATGESDGNDGESEEQSGDKASR